MNKKQAFEMFGLKQTNQVWSWSAISEDGKTVATTVWADQVDRTSDASLFVDTFNLPHNQRNELWRDANGNRERIQHLSHAVKHNSGIVRVLLVHSVDPNAYPREVKPNSVEPLTERYFKVVKLDEQTGEFQLQEVSVSSKLQDLIKGAPENRFFGFSVEPFIDEALNNGDAVAMRLITNALSKRIEANKEPEIFPLREDVDVEIFSYRRLVFALGKLQRKKQQGFNVMQPTGVGLHESSPGDFVFEDGEVWPSIEEHKALMGTCRYLEQGGGAPINASKKYARPRTGEIFEQDGLRLICLNSMASYGGGSAALWAAEGFDAQLTMQGTPYVCGKCLEIIEEPLGIKFQPVGRGWMDYEDEERRLEARFLKLEEIRRYDINHRESEWYRHPG